MGHLVVVEYLPPTSESNERFQGEPQNLYFVTRNEKQSLAHIKLADWQQTKVDKIEYFRKFGFTDEQEIIFMPNYDMANLTGLYVIPYFSNSKRWGTISGPEHPYWLYHLPIQEEITQPFIVVMNWGDLFEKNYTGLKNPFFSCYLYQRNMPEPSEEKDPVIREAEQWSKLGYPLDEIYAKYSLSADASMEQLTNASQMPVVVAKWNPVRDDVSLQWFPTIEKVLSPE